MKKKHWREFDFFYTPCKNTIAALESAQQQSLLFWKSLGQEGSLVEEFEFTLGLSLVAIQKYMSHVMYDLNEIGILMGKAKFLKQGQIIEKSPITDLTLINSLANYFKHNQEYPLHKSTERSLNSVGLDLNDSSLLNKGLGILSKDYSMIQVLDIVQSVRKQLISSYHK